MSHEWPATAALFAGLVAVVPELSMVSTRDRALLLRDLVCRAVDELKADGRTFPSVSDLVVRLAGEAGMDETRDKLMLEQLVAWCAQRFFAP